MCFGVIEAAKAVPIPMDREIIHVLPQHFIVDGQRRHHRAHRHERCSPRSRGAHCHGAVTTLQNIVKCANRCEVQVADIVLEQLASSASRTPDERKSWVWRCRYRWRNHRHQPVASTQHRSHLGDSRWGQQYHQGHRGRPQDAHVRCRGHQGQVCLRDDRPGRQEAIQVPSVGGRRPRALKREILSTIVEPRAEEMLALVRQRIWKPGRSNSWAAGLSSPAAPPSWRACPSWPNLGGARTARGPRGVGGLVDVVRNPRFATGVGLVLFGHQQDLAPHLSIKEDGIYSRISSECDSDRVLRSDGGQDTIPTKKRASWMRFRGNKP